MVGGLTEFAVYGLHGHKNFKVRPKDDTLIIVGENGSGKTTILRMLFYFVSGRWLSLRQFPFGSITAIIKGESFSLTRDDLGRAFRRHDHRLLSRYPSPISNRIRALISSGDLDRLPLRGRSPRGSLWYPGQNPNSRHIRVHRG